MDSLTIEIEEEVASELRRRARLSGRSPEEEARRILHVEMERSKPADRKPGTPGRRRPEDAARIAAALAGLGRPRSQPFDLKACRDEIWNFVD